MIRAARDPEQIEVRFAWPMYPTSAPGSAPTLVYNRCSARWDTPTSPKPARGCSGWLAR